MSAPRKYPDELRERAVREVFASGRPIAHVAADLGIHREALRQWVRQAEADRAPAASRVLPADVDAELKELRREVAELRRANEILKTASIFFAGVEPICRTLGFAPSTYYAARVRPPSARALADRQLVAQIHDARTGYRAVYGVRKTWRELSRRRVQVGRDRVGRLMRAQGLEGIRRGKRHRTTTAAEAAADRARDLVDRRFVAAAPNRLWVADITYLRTWAGFCYLAFILDVFSRRIVGWQIATHMRTDLVMDALEMAAALRRPSGGLGAHSDRGSQYTSIRYTERLDQLGIAPSVGSRGDAYDNAMAEAFIGTFKAELVDGRRFGSFGAAEHETLSWIGFYNHERLHEELGDVPPAEFEDCAASADRSTPNGPFGPAEPDRPALVGGAPVGLGSSVEST